MSHHTLYGAKSLQDYAATFKSTRDDVSDSTLRHILIAFHLSPCFGSIEGGLDLINPDIRLTILNLGLVGETELEDLSDIDIETLMLEQYLALNRNNSQVGVKRLEIEKSIIFEIKSQLLRELLENTFSGGKTEDAMEHLRKILEIASLFNTPGISGNDIMLRIFSLNLFRSAKSGWVETHI
ncbi:hypothetical protein Tco_0194619 [Tanacetum coccineum]